MRPAPAPISVDLAAIVYTSGSTGRPKGVTLTHANMAFAAGSIVDVPASMRADDRVLCVVPLSFDYGLYQLLMCVRVGATLVLERGFAFPGRVLELLDARARSPACRACRRSSRCSLALARTAATAHDLPHLRFLTNTAAALAARDDRRAARRLPARAALLDVRPDRVQARHLPAARRSSTRGPTSVGIPIPGTEAWIEDDAGRRLAPGEVGELVVRGAHVMQGYWNEPGGDRRAAAPRPLAVGARARTGDLFRQDEEGFLYFVGRRDDIIKSRGEKVAPQRGRGGPAREPRACARRPSSASPTACSARRSSPTSSARASRAHTRRAAPPLRAAPRGLHGPARVELRDELPTTPNGKVDRRSAGGRGAQRDA